jgi:pyridoxamine 5'-phosphate oxidase
MKFEEDEGRMSLVSERLRALKSLAGPFPGFDPAAAPDDPRDLFAAWFRQAIAAGVHEPHAMTLSTVDEAGCPDARVLILKTMDHDGWHFATGRLSRKGRQLDSTPIAALTFYWRPLGRQVRLRGAAQDMGPAARDADFRAKPAGSRAAALLARQSDVLSGNDEFDRALERQRARLAEDPGLVAPDWAVYALDPTEVEFWQADEQRRHIRLRYRRHEAAWIHERLWP